MLFSTLEVYIFLLVTYTVYSQIFIKNIKHYTCDTSMLIMSGTHKVVNQLNITSHCIYSLSIIIAQQLLIKSKL